MSLIPAFLLALALAGDDSTARPVRVAVALPSDWSLIQAPGRTMAARRGLVVGTVTADLARLIRLPRTTMHVQYLQRLGRPASPDVGDLQGFSNIEADRLARVGEWWVETSSPGGRVRLKAGNVDANTEFAWTSHGSIFLNSALGYSPAIVALPTFPDPATSASVFLTSRDARWTFSAGVFDGGEADVGTRALGLERLVNRPGELFTIVEAGRRWGSQTGGLDGRVGVGGWQHGSAIRRDDPERKRYAHEGMYLVLDQGLLARATPEGPREVLGAFVQLASARRIPNALAAHASVGATLSNLPGWGSDSAGVALSWVQAGGAADVPMGTQELAVELLYSRKPLRWLTVRSDLQWILAGPSAPGRHHATVATVRLIVAPGFVISSERSGRGTFFPGGSGHYRSVEGSSLRPA